MPGVAAAVMTAAVALTAACGGSDAAPEARPTIALLRVVPDDDHGVFISELRAQGWNIGRDVAVFPEDPERLFPDEDAARATLRSWVGAGVDVVVAFSTPFARLAAEEGRGTPVLFLLNDPVAAGLVGDTQRPDRGATGVTFRTPADRTLALAQRLVGTLGHVGYLRPADDPGVEGHRAAVRAAAEELGVRVTEASFQALEDVAPAVEELVAAGVEAVWVANSTATVQALEPLRSALSGANLPVIANTDFVDFAVLIVTPDGAELRRQLARQAARLLAGADVSAVPVEDPRKFVVILNRTVAAALGLPEPDPALLRQADVVR
jgi:putative ABC transport system substrate-binding protein